MPYLPGFLRWIADHRALMTLLEIAGYGIIWAAIVAFIFRAARWTLFLTPQLPGSIPAQPAQVPGRQTRNRVRRLLQQLELARSRHRDLREYVAAWGAVIVWLLIGMFCVILLCAIVTTYHVLRPHLMHNQIFFVFSPPLLIVLTFGCGAIILRLLNGVVEATRFDTTVEKTLKLVRSILSQHVPAADLESFLAAIATEYAEAKSWSGVTPEESSPAPIRGSKGASKNVAR